MPILKPQPYVILRLLLRESQVLIRQRGDVAATAWSASQWLIKHMQNICLLEPARIFEDAPSGKKTITRDFYG